MNNDKQSRAKELISFYVMASCLLEQLADQNVLKIKLKTPQAWTHAVVQVAIVLRNAKSLENEILEQHIEVKGLVDAYNLELKQRGQEWINADLPSTFQDLLRRSEVKDNLRRP